jgi:hypothetical protein
MVPTRFLSTRKPGAARKLSQLAGFREAESDLVAPASRQTNAHATGGGKPELAPARRTASAGPAAHRSSL